MRAAAPAKTAQQLCARFSSIFLKLMVMVASPAPWLESHNFAPAMPRVVTSPSCSDSAPWHGSRIWLGAYPWLSPQGSLSPWASWNFLGQWVLNHADVFDHFITVTTVCVTWGKCVLTVREKTLAVTGWVIFHCFHSNSIIAPAAKIPNLRWKCLRGISPLLSPVARSPVG